MAGAPWADPAGPRACEPATVRWPRLRSRALVWRAEATMTARRALTPHERVLRASTIASLSPRQVEVLALSPVRWHEARALRESERTAAMQALVSAVAEAKAISTLTMAAKTAASDYERYLVASWMSDRLAAPAAAGPVRSALIELARIDPTPRHWRTFWNAIRND